MYKIGLLVSGGVTGLILLLYGFNIDRAMPLIPMGLLSGLAPYFIARYLKFSKLKVMEESFPEFLRALSESQKSGITFPQAIVNASKIDYGPLSEEVKKMSYQISWGIPLPKVLEKFSDRMKDSEFLRRSIAIILEAYRSGGDVAEVMESVAESARMVKELEAERKSKFSQQLLIMYAIYIIFIVIIIALNKILLPMFSLSASQDTGGMAFSMGTIDPAFYRRIFLHMILIQAVFAGLIAGQVGEGSIVAGIKHSGIMLVIGTLAFVFFLPSQSMLISIDAPYDVFPPGSIYSLEGFVLKSDKTPLSEVDVEIAIGGTIYRATTDNLGLFSKEIVLPIDPGLHKIEIKATHSSGKGSYKIEVSIG
ncbi:MAG: type II secretion system F family protein [Candidatus Altiarchaeota archaeon]|nr:type II secretion system F family protein [Candidatus Altiarchaeota archaeon]